MEVADNPRIETASWEEYKLGGDNMDKSIPVDYTAEGGLLRDVQIGEHLLMYRTKRNDVECGGVLSTSRITDIVVEKDLTILTTQNSVYRVTRL